MTSPNEAMQKMGWGVLEKLFSESANVWVIHYSCESFYDRKDGTSPRITSIAVRNLSSAQTLSFSIHQVAEQRQVGIDEIETKYDEHEKIMLESFFEHVGSHKGMYYLHWNMRDINYGFAAIEHRFQVLKGCPEVIEDGKKIDLARVLIDIFGVGYIGHPRLESLMSRNSIIPRDFLNGKAEADAFEQRDYVALHQSTLRKVDVLANIAERAYNRQLKTNTSWWEMHGGKLRTFINLVVTHPYYTAILGLLAIVGIVITVRQS